MSRRRILDEVIELHPPAIGHEPDCSRCDDEVDVERWRRLVAELVSDSITRIRTHRAEHDYACALCGGRIRRGDLYDRAAVIPRVRYPVCDPCIPMNRPRVEH